MAFEESMKYAMLYCGNLSIFPGIQTDRSHEALAKYTMIHESLSFEVIMFTLYQCRLCTVSSFPTHPP